MRQPQEQPKDYSDQRSGLLRPPDTNAKTEKIGVAILFAVAMLGILILAFSL